MWTWYIVYDIMYMDKDIKINKDPDITEQDSVKFILRPFEKKIKHCNCWIKIYTPDELLIYSK